MAPAFGDYQHPPHHPLAEHAQSSALYQQLLQRQQEELMLRNPHHPGMMLHQPGLLGSPAAYPPSFSSGLGLQPGFQPGWLWLLWLFWFKGLVHILIPSTTTVCISTFKQIINIKSAAFQILLKTKIIIWWREKKLLDKSRIRWTFVMDIRLVQRHAPGIHNVVYCSFGCLTCFPIVIIIIITWRVLSNYDQSRARR